MRCTWCTRAMPGYTMYIAPCSGHGVHSVWCSSRQAPGLMAACGARNAADERARDRAHVHAHAYACARCAASAAHRPLLVPSSTSCGRRQPPARENAEDDVHARMRVHIARGCGRA